MDDGSMIVALVILGIFFWGDPDLYDALMHYLMQECS